MLTGVKRVKNKIKNIFIGNNKTINQNLQNINLNLQKINKNEQILLKNVEILKRELSIQKNQMLNLETMLKDVHYSIIDDKCFCPVCESEIPTFIPGGVNNRENAICPKCGSFERNRAAYLFLKEKTDIFDKNIKMLHFAPERALSEIFGKKENID